MGMAGPERSDQSVTQPRHMPSQDQPTVAPATHAECAALEAESGEPIP